jgi:antitoxin component YwqK of YwqJK toxin-antitoxin module
MDYYPKIDKKFYETSIHYQELKKCFNPDVGKIILDYLINKKNEYQIERHDIYHLFYLEINDLIHGNVLTYGVNNNKYEFVRSDEYKNDKLDGKILIYDNNFIIREFSYKNNKLHGKSLWYNKDNKLEIKHEYKYGIEDGVSFLYNYNKKICIEKHYFNGYLEYTLKYCLDEKDFLLLCE